MLSIRTKNGKNGKLLGWIDDSTDDFKKENISWSTWIAKRVDRADESVSSSSLNNLMPHISSQFFMQTETIFSDRVPLQLNSLVATVKTKVQGKTLTARDN